MVRHSDAILLRAQSVGISREAAQEMTTWTLQRIITPLIQRQEQEERLALIREMGISEGVKVMYYAEGPFVVKDTNPHTGEVYLTGRPGAYYPQNLKVVKES